MNIKLRFVNRSNDGNKSEVVIYQTNLVTSMASLPVAWKVIRYCGRDCFHPFDYPNGYEISVTDEYLNYVPRLSVNNGHLLRLMATPIGSRRLFRVGAAAATNEVDVVNGLERGAIDVCVYKGGRLLAIKTCVVPGQKAVFQFPPVLWVGVASQVQEGAAMRSAVLPKTTTELSLIGIASADIVMTGGGMGQEAQPIEFNLENIVQV